MIFCNRLWQCSNYVWKKDVFTSIQSVTKIHIACSWLAAVHYIIMAVANLSNSIYFQVYSTSRHQLIDTLHTWIFVTGPAKTWHICTNYTCSENDTFLGLCLISMFCKINFLCFLIDLWTKYKDFSVIPCALQKILLVAVQK